MIPGFAICPFILFLYVNSGLYHDNVKAHTMVWLIVQSRECTSCNNPTYLTVFVCHQLVLVHCSLVLELLTFDGSIRYPSGDTTLPR